MGDLFILKRAYFIVSQVYIRNKGIACLQEKWSGVETSAAIEVCLGNWKSTGTRLFDRGLSCAQGV